jgi:hypothetical protein
MYTKTMPKISKPYLGQKEPNNQICQSIEGLLEALQGGTKNNENDISLTEVLIFTAFVFDKVEKSV